MGEAKLKRRDAQHYLDCYHANGGSPGGADQACALQTAAELGYSIRAAQTLMRYAMVKQLTPKGYHDRPDDGAPQGA